MSSFIQQLPTELLILIFDHVDSVSQMAECGLVCQEWNRIAQPLMLSKTLFIASEEKAYQLYYYLLKHPYHATRIKKMDIHLQDSSKGEGFIKMISVAFTPSMESLTGLANSNRFFETLIKTADKYDTDSYSRLKSIPYTFHDYGFYNTALTKFRDTLESMHLTYTNVSQRITAAHPLSNFKNLNKIHIDIRNVNAVAQLDTMLRDCTRVEELGIHMVRRNQFVFGGRFLSWNRETVQQNLTMKTICIHGECNLQLLEFLLYKYPHVNRVVIDTIHCGYRWNAFHHRIFMLARDVYRIVDIMHDTSLSYSIKFRLQRGSTVKAIKNYILGHNGKILVSNSFFQNVKYIIDYSYGFGVARICTERIHYIEATHNLN